MDIALIVARWSGRLPPGFVPPALRQSLPACAQTRCTRPVWIKPDGTLAKSCRPCLDRRAASCRRRRKHFTERGGCRRCAYRPRAEGDYLCTRCRGHRDAEREHAGTTATPPSSTKAPRDPTRRITRVTRTAACRPGTAAPSPNPTRLIGHLFRIPSRSPARNGAAQ